MGDAPGAVTLMMIPRNDPEQPDAPVADAIFLDTICRYLDPRRLVTTEYFCVVRFTSLSGFRLVSMSLRVLRPPKCAKRNGAARLSAPIVERRRGLTDSLTSLTTPAYASAQKGWPLSKAVTARELLAVASRVSGVLLVNDVFIAEDTNRQAIRFR